MHTCIYTLKTWKNQHSLHCVVALSPTNNHHDLPYEASVYSSEDGLMRVAVDAHALQFRCSSTELRPAVPPQHYWHPADHASACSIFFFEEEEEVEEEEEEFEYNSVLYSGLTRKTVSEAALSTQEWLCDCSCRCVDSNVFGMEYFSRRSASSGCCWGMPWRTEKDWRLRGLKCARNGIFLVVRVRDFQLILPKLKYFNLVKKLVSVFSHKKLF